MPAGITYKLYYSAIYITCQYSECYRYHFLLFIQFLGGVFVSFYDNLKQICEAKGVKVTPTVLECGGTKGIISGWKKGIYPNSEIVMKLSVLLNVPSDALLFGIATPLPNNLSEDEEELLRYYKQLPEKEKIRLVSRAEAIADMYAEAAPEPVPPMIVIKHSMYKVSAGTGERLSDSDDWDEIEIPDTPEARRADFCLTIYGNSMEPVYYDGDIVLVKQQNAVERGQIGIFIIEGSGYIKKFGGDRLISLNDQYDDIMFSEYDPDDIRCSGLVIGRV